MYGKRPGNFVELTGQRFGRLTVIAFAGTTPAQRALWRCQCDCGTSCIVQGKLLRRKRMPTRSCGCLHTTVLEERNTIHGLSRTAEYKTYYAMIQRCTNPKNPAYPDYGGRGIMLEWTSFEQFLSDMGARPSPEHSIDRINVNGNYSAANCRWATGTEQANNARSNVRITFQGRTQTATQWAKETGIGRQTLTWRLKQGWPIEQVLQRNPDVYNLQHGNCTNKRK